MHKTSFFAGTREALENSFYKDAISDNTLT